MTKNSGVSRMVGKAAVARRAVTDLTVTDRTSIKRQNGSEQSQFWSRALEVNASGVTTRTARQVRVLSFPRRPSPCRVGRGGGDERGIRDDLLFAHNFRSPLDAISVPPAIREVRFAPSVPGLSPFSVST